MRYYLGNLIFLLLAIVNGVHGQWCCVDSTLLIKDNKTASLRLLISSANNNNLASPTQGICGVRIKFDHKFIGDLTIDLISPAGQKVRLIGPVGDSRTSAFSTWNVTFVPCGSKAIPDPGFKKKWDNLQNWGILGKFYNGTYYPQSGCLEDFDTGPVNGIWTLIISDDKKFYEGKIESFCLLFCDQDGINCTDCSPNGGVFSNDTLHYCYREASLAAIEKVLFPVYKPDSTIYGYQYMVVQNDMILFVGNQIDLTNFSAGTYTICGLSYILLDSLKLPKIGDLISAFKNDLVINKNGFCAELSKNCLTAIIHPTYGGQINRVNLCRGDKLTINNVDYDQAGIYNIYLKTIYGCDSVITLFLDVVDIQIQVNGIDTIDCSNPIVVLDLTNSVLTTKSVISWFTIDGNFLDLTDPLKPKINKAGSYKLLISDSLCLDSFLFDIFTRDIIPSLELKSDTINCLRQTATITAQSNASIPGYNWSDGFSPLGSGPSLQVAKAGIYYVTVTDQNGCSNYGSIEVISDTLNPEIHVQAEEISCRSNSSTLMLSSNKTISSFLWQGPSLFNSTLPLPMTDKSGFYTVTVQADNGCIASEIFELVSIISIPDYFAEVDTLNCNNNFNIAIRARSSFILDSIIYYNLSGFKDTVISPNISSPGIYNIRIVDTAGCSLDTFIEVFIDSLKPQINLQSGILDCNKDSVQIILNYIVRGKGDRFFWTGPPGFDSDKQNPFVKEVGLYHVKVISDNGCSVEDSISVLQDIGKPDISLKAGILDCNNQQIIIDASVANIISYEWTGPNLFHSFLEDPAIIDSGLYRLIVISNNGCSSEKSIQIEMDRDPPIKNLIGDTLSCIKDSVLIVLIKNTMTDSISWMGPSNFQSDNDSVYVKSPGQYQVYARGANGCVDFDSIFIFIDTLKPRFLLSSDTLGCLIKKALIKIRNIDSIQSYIWRDSLGNSSTVKDLMVDFPGWYFVNAFGRNGCQSNDSIQVQERISNPVLSLIPDTLTCFDTIASLSFSKKENDWRYVWSGPGFFSSTDSMISTKKPGWYYYSVTNHFGCTTQDSFYLEDHTSKPKVLISDPKFNCITKQNAALTAFFVDSLLQFEWRSPSGQINPSRTISVLSSGYYRYRGVNEYGCILVDSVFVVFDTTAPVINKAYMDSLTCSRFQVIPLIEISPGNVTYEWRGPMNFQSSLPNPILTKAGSYNLRITAPNFCFLDTMIELLKDSLLPTILTTGAVITCLSDSVMLNLVSQDSLNSIIWLSPKGLSYSTRNPFVKDSGWYYLSVLAKNNCLLRDSVYVGFNKKIPSLTIRDTFLQCIPDSTQLILTTNDPVIQFFWQGPNSFNSTLQNPFIKDTGYFIINLMGANHCVTTDSIKVSSNKNKPNLMFQADTLDCINRTVTLSALFDSLNITYLWSGPNLLDSTTKNPVITVDGDYRIQIMNQFGCKNDTTVKIVIDTVRPNGQIMALDTLICSKNRARLVFDNPCINCNYSWSTMNGLIISGSNDDTLMIGEPGSYNLLITDASNHCVNNYNIAIVADSTMIQSVLLDIKPPTCFGFNNGEIVFDSILGGRRPYQLSFDKISYMDIGDIQNLAAGALSIYIKDRNGCEFDTILNIKEPAPLLLNLGNDTLINYGQNYLIPAFTNADTTTLLRLNWSPDQYIHCPTCFNVIASPTQTTLFRLEITDESGCKAVDDILIEVLIHSDLFIPNVFSPNKDQINDFFTIFSGKEKVFIKSLRIYDRWGDQVFAKENFEVDGQLAVWDGTQNGKDLMVGVYVFVLEVESISKSRYIKKGDISLMR